MEKVDHQAILAVRHATFSNCHDTPYPGDTLKIKCG
jgi:hypothetical protein